MTEGEPSATAGLIALATIFLAGDASQGTLLPAGAAEWSERFLEAAHPWKLGLTRIASRRPFRGLVCSLERAFLPGILAHYAARKRFIDDAARVFFEAGGRQLVVLGAGFDSLAVRVAAARPDVRCIELDHPATQASKRQGLQGRAPPNLQLVPAELGRVSLEEALAHAGPFSADQRTFFVLEGVSMYLTEPVVRQILEACVRSGGARTQIAWTFMQPDARGRLAFRRSREEMVNVWLAMKDEPFRWGITPERLPAFAREVGLRVLEVADAQTFRGRYLLPAGLVMALAEGEACCLCEKI